MALTDEQFDSILHATVRMHAKGKMTNFSRRVAELRRKATISAATACTKLPEHTDGNRCHDRYIAEKSNPAGISGGAIDEDRWPVQPTAGSVDNLSNEGDDR
ncbi:MAG TPA: hypothetical protein VHA71_04920 [Rhodanobacteraceae bacterium]|jgi:hypothetical protein|nr:hypothetical protein [Rhodanobacteraceae bacterium]